MMQMSAAAQDLAEPAKDLEELYSRLSTRIGSIVELNQRDLVGVSFRAITAGPLGSVRFVDYEDGSATLILALGQYVDLKARLSSKLSVLVDGQWRVLHAPSAVGKTRGA